MMYRSHALALTFSMTALFCAAGAEAQPLRVGVQLPVTGERASVGRLIVNGLQMALEAVNGREGEQEPRLEITLADDESTPEGAVKAMGELARDSRIVAVVGEINSPFVMASVPTVNKEGLPYLTAGSSPRTTVSSPWIFRVGASDALLASLLTGYMVRELHVKNLAVLHDKTGIHNQRADLITREFKDKYKIVPVLDATWAPGDRDFTAQLEQVKMSHAEAILALGETPEGGSFLRQAGSSGVHAQVITQRDFGVKRVLNEAGRAAEGTLVITEYSPELQGPATQAWNAAYSRQYGGDANVIAAQYYDALMLLAQAVKTGGGSRAGVKSGLEHLNNFPGVVANYTFDAGRNGVHRFYIAKVDGGRLSLLKILEENPGNSLPE